MEKDNFSNFENAYKLYENSNNDNFSQWWSGEKGNLHVYKRKNIWGLVAF